MATNEGETVAIDAAVPKIHTYHCLCAQLIVASTTSLEKLAKRASDRSSILALPDLGPGESAPSHHAILHDTEIESLPVIIRREDGFEKRFLQRCPRCKLTLGYQLDKSMFDATKQESGCNTAVVYLLPGGLVATEEVVTAKKMDKDIELLTAGA